MVRARENLIGAYAFLVGVVLAVILGIFGGGARASSTSMLYILLVVLGLVVGFLMNSADKNTNTFLFASLALVIVGGLGNSTLIFIYNISPILGMLNDVLSALLVLFIPATIIVSLKTVFAITRI